MQVWQMAENIYNDEEVDAAAAGESEAAWKVFRIYIELKKFDLLLYKSPVHNNM